MLCGAPDTEQRERCRRCGLGSAGTDKLVELVRAEQAAAVTRGEQPALYGAKITGGGSGGELLARRLITQSTCL